LVAPVYDSILLAEYNYNATKLYLFKNDFLETYSFGKRSIETLSTSGVAVFGKENQKGVVNKEGRIILKPRYKIEYGDSCLLFYNDKECGLIDMKGNILVPPGTYEWIIDYGYDYLVMGKNKRIGMMHENAELFIDTVFYTLSSYDRELGYCWASKDSVNYHSQDFGCCQGNFGLVERGKDFSIAPQFTEVNRFNEFGIAIVSKAYKYGLINRKGDILLPFVFDNIEQAENRYFYITKDSLVGIADKKGKIVAEPSFQQINAFNGEYAKFFMGGKEGVIHESGKMIIPLIDNLADTEVPMEDIPFPDFHESQELEGTALTRFTSLYKNYSFELIDSFPDKTVRRIINNKVLSMVPDDDERHEASQSNSLCDYTLMTPHGYCSQPDWEMSSEDRHFSYYIKISSHGKKYFSIIIQEEYAFRYTSYEYDFLNYRIENKKAIPIKLDYLFTLGYQDKLNAIILQEVRKKDDVELDCNNPEAFLEIVKEKFTVSDEGIVFNFEIFDPEGYQGPFSFAEIPIPFSLLKDILQNNFK
jgi:hypothetical protein